jgi:RNA polymerase sigma-54 factor
MKLALRQTQRVVMTPLLQQAIQLLQLSTLELEQVVRKELEENPLLEELPVDGAEGPAPASADGAAEPPPTPPPAEPVSAETSTDGERADDLPFDLSR